MLTHSLTHSLTLTYSLTCSLTYLLTYSLTHSLKVFKNVDAWKNRTLDAFNSNVENVLRGYVFSIEDSSKKIIEENMLKEAIARSIKDFDNKSLAVENHNKVLTHSLTHSLTLTYSLTHSYLLTYLLTHSLTHSGYIGLV